MVLGIPGYTSEGGGRSGVSNTRINVGERRKNMCTVYQDSRQREEEVVVLGIPVYTSERGGTSGVRNTRIQVRGRRKMWC